MAQPAKWLNQLVDAVASCMTCLDGPNPVQCHFFLNEAEGPEWEVTVFGEQLSFGGRLHSLSYDARYSVDVLSIAALFDKIDSCLWQTTSINPSDELGPHVSCSGEVKGHKVWLRVLGHSPERLREQASDLGIPKRD